MHKTPRSRLVLAGILTALLGVSIFLILENAGEKNVLSGAVDAIESAPKPIPVSQGEIATGASSRSTFEDVMQGEGPDPTDSELSDWIRVNGGSEAAYLAAYGFRKHPFGGEWLEKGLQAHPESLPLVLAAANAELMAHHTGSGHSRKWIDRFRELDPENGLGWIFAALAEYYRGNDEFGHELWKQAARRPLVRFYSSRFENASYEFGKGTGETESVASLLGDAAAPVLTMPKYSDTIRMIRSYTESLADAGFQSEADELATATYRIGILFFQRSIADNGWAIYPSTGIQTAQLIKEQVPREVLDSYSEVAAEMERFIADWRSIRGKSPGGDDPSEEEYLEWSFYRRTFGETAAAVEFSR